MYLVALRQFVLLLMFCCCFFASSAGAEFGSIQFNVDGSDSKPLPCRIHVRDHAGQPVKAFGQPFWHDHFVCAGRVSVTVVPGEYTWEIERGPEYAPANGKSIVIADKTEIVNVVLPRIVNLVDEGWYSGDTHVHRPVEEIERLMLAEDLRFAPVIGWWNTPAPDAEPIATTVFEFGDERIYSTQAGEDEREGGALLYFGLQRQLDLSVKSREYPSPMQFVQQARQQQADVWIDIEKPFWWDVPTWIAVAQPDSMGIAHNHMHRNGVLANEAWGRPRDESTFPGVHGNGLWTQAIYYHVLNCGLRIPPSAGSASGVLPNPVGYNRVYVHLQDAEFTRDNWWEALKAGRCFVTNGPLLRVQIDGTDPGTVLGIAHRRELSLAIKLATNDPVSELEVIHNGVVVKRIAVDNSVTVADLNALVVVSEPGWILVRAIADVESEFQFASTAPWYLETEDVPRRISRSSVQFFLDWLQERIERVRANVDDEQERDAVLSWHIAARQFWMERLESANAD